MKRLMIIAAVAASALFTTACYKDADIAVSQANYGDKPASVTCWTYGAVTFNGRSTGKVIYDEGGRVTFVDAASKRLVTLEGDCRIFYD